MHAKGGILSKFHEPSRHHMSTTRKVGAIEIGEKKNLGLAFRRFALINKWAQNKSGDFFLTFLKRALVFLGFLNYPQ